ncbi:ABC transporter permease subunit [Ornithinimicrobium sp. Y1694]|uniref:ABC transporter permease subunit n=1 Tax=Ornithinimicrobium sp. Y1694 TaxID=3418590 RepID=UPI003CEDD52B
MIRLTMVELRRIAARKVLWIALLASLAIAIVTVVGVFLTTQQIDSARAGFNQQYNQMVEQLPADIEQCERDQEAERRATGDPTIDYGCNQIRVPTIDEMYGAMPSLADQYQMLLGGLAYPFMFLALAMGSTMVAAEFAHRTMGSWLTFEPRRTLVYLSKVLAPAIASLPVALLGLVTVFVGIPAVFRWFRIDDSVTGNEWADLAWIALRICLLAVLTGAFGAGLAFILRHSGLVIGLMVGYLVLIEGILGSIFNWLGKLALSRNIHAVINDGTQWSVWPSNCGWDGNECREIIYRISLTHGVVVLGVLLVIVAVLGWVRFVRSDVD